VLLCGITGAAVGMVATWLHQQLVRVADGLAPGRPTAATARRTAMAAAVAAGVFAVTVPPAGDLDGTVQVTIGPVQHGRAHLDVAADPSLVEGAYWFTAFSWQGGGAIHGELHEVAPGRWRTDEPMPVTGSWKTMVRVHTPLRTMAAAPVYLPADPAIPAEAYPAVDGPRELQDETEILRREERQDVPGWLWGTAYLVVGGLFLLLFAIVAAGYVLAGRQGSPLVTRSRSVTSTG
jgi:hypothetical protein